MCFECKEWGGIGVWQELHINSNTATFRQSLDFEIGQSENVGGLGLVGYIGLWQNLLVFAF